jgi:hypothetical protein
VRSGGGRLPTLKCVGNLSLKGILDGCVVVVQSSSVGKYSRLFSGWKLLYSSHFLRNSGQLRSQLAWVTVQHETQNLLFSTLHLLVLCCTPHVPHVSTWALQSAAKCPHLRHFILYLSFLGNKRLLHT